MEISFAPPAEECITLGGDALACIVDVRDEASIEAAVADAVAKFGGIDVLINCASAIFPQATEEFNTNRFNLMFEVGPRGSMLTAKHWCDFLLRFGCFATVLRRFCD